MKKRILALALMLCIALLGTAGAAAERLDGDGGVSRGEFLSVLAEASGEDTSQSSYLDLTAYFADGKGQPDHVKWAFAKWLVNGDGDSRLRTADAITREEAAAILGRYLDYKYVDLPPGCGTGSPSMDNIASWAQSGVMRCWMYGVIDMSDEQNVTYPDGTASSALEFRPKDTVSLAEARAWCENAQKLTMSAIYQPEQRAFADSLVAAADAKGNWTLSPYSARLCLAMLANGAKGDTQKELLAALQIDDLDAFNTKVQEQMKTYAGYARIMSLDTANSIWLNQSWFDGKGAFLPDFQKKMQAFYSAEAREVTNKNSVEQVNRWVDEKTRGKIPTILTEQNRQFVTALVNAVYFKAAWANEFPASRTEKAAFTNADGTTSKVDMMHQTDWFGYYATPGVEALKMDYRKYAVDNEEGDNWEYFRDADFSMYLIKADEGLDVQNLLDKADFSEGAGEIRVSVPKFKIEYGQALDDALKALGVTAAYDHEKADMSAMVDPSGLPGGELFLDMVLQKTYIAVDEKGTEAAAVTAAMDGAGSAMETRPPLVREFTADSPFYFAIRDNANGEILFVGRYENAE